MLYTCTICNKRNLAEKDLRGHAEGHTPQATSMDFDALLTAFRQQEGPLCPDCGEPPHWVDYMQRVRCKRLICDTEDGAALLAEDEADSDVIDETGHTFTCPNGHTWEASEGHYKWP